MATLSPLEIEFLSELMDIVIIPSFTMDTLDFISVRTLHFNQLILIL